METFIILMRNALRNMNKKIAEWSRNSLAMALIVLVYVFFFQIMYCWMLFGHPVADFTFIELAYSLLLNYIPILLFAIVTLFVCSSTALSKLWQKLTIDVASSAVALVAIGFLFKLVTGMEVNWGGAIFNGVLVWLGIEFWILSEQKRRAMIRENILQRENLGMKYEILQSYVNPHFLYNSLDMLCTLIEEDAKQESIDFIASLSAYYRAMTRRINITTTSVSEEIKMMRNYFEIVRHNYGEGLVLQIEGNENDDMQLIPYSLQLLVENILKHNVINPSRPIKITIKICESGITVSNTYMPKSGYSQKSSGLGLSYLKNMYAYHGSEVEISRTDNQFKVYLPRIA